MGLFGKKKDKKDKKEKGATDSDKKRASSTIAPATPQLQTISEIEKKHVEVFAKPAEAPPSIVTTSPPPKSTTPETTSNKPAATTQPTAPVAVQPVVQPAVVQQQQKKEPEKPKQDKATPDTLQQAAAATPALQPHDKAYVAQMRAKRRAQSFFNINEFKELSASRAYPMAPTTPVPEAVTSKKSMENITFGDIFHSQVYEAFVHLRSMARDLNTPLLPPEFVFVGKRGQGKSALIEAFLGFIMNHVSEVPDVFSACTRMPIAVRLMNNPSCNQAKFSIKYKKNSIEVQRDEISVQDLSSEIEKLNADAKQITDEAITVTLEHKNVLDAVFIDTPGVLFDDESAAISPDVVKVQDDSVKKEQLQVQKMVQDLMFPQHRRIIAVEEATEWNDIKVLNFIKQTDPTLIRTTLVLTKFHSLAKSFTTTEQLNRYLSLAPRLSNFFFASLFSSKVRSKHCPTTDEYLSRIAAAYKRDKRLLEDLNFDNTYSKHIGIFNMRSFLLKSTWNYYQEQVPEMINTIRSNMREADKKLQMLQKLPVMSSEEQVQTRALRGIASSFTSQFLRIIHDLLDGSIEGLPQELGETSVDENEANNIGQWLDDNYQELLVPSTIEFAQQKLYGGQQLKRLLHTFSAITKNLSVPVLTDDDLAVYAGTSMSTGTLNISTVIWAASEITQQKLKSMFKTLVDQLIQRAIYVMKRFSIIAARVMKNRSSEMAMWSKKYQASEHDFERYPYFSSRVRHLFDDFVDHQGKIFSKKCADEFLEARTIYWSSILDPKVKEGIDLNALTPKSHEAIALVVKRVYQSVSDHLVQNVSMKLVEYLVNPMKTQLWSELHGKLSSMDSNELRSVFQLSAVTTNISDEQSALKATFAQCLEQESIFIRLSASFSTKREKKGNKKPHFNVKIDRSAERRFKYELHGLEAEQWNHSTSSIKNKYAQKGTANSAKFKGVSFGSEPVVRNVARFAEEDEPAEHSTKTFPKEGAVFKDKVSFPKEKVAFAEPKPVVKPEAPAVPKPAQVAPPQQPSVDPSMERELPQEPFSESDDEEEEEEDGEQQEDNEDEDEKDDSTSNFPPKRTSSPPPAKKNTASDDDDENVYNNKLDDVIDDINEDKLKEVSLVGIEAHMGQLGWDQVQDLIDAITSSSAVKQVNLSKTGASNKIANLLFTNLKKNASIETVDLTNNEDITDDIAANVSTMLTTNKTVKAVLLAGTKLTSKGVLTIINGMTKNNTIKKVTVPVDQDKVDGLLSLQ